MQATSFVSAAKKHPRSDRNRHILANRQMILYSCVGPSQPKESLMVYFSLPDDMPNELKPKLSKER